MEDTILLSTVGSPAAHVQMHRIPLLSVSLCVPVQRDTGPVEAKGGYLALLPILFRQGRSLNLERGWQ